MDMIDKNDVSTYIYRANNYLYDQIIVSNSILDGDGFDVSDSSVYILDLPKYRQQEGKYKNTHLGFGLVINFLVDIRSFSCKNKF